MEKSQTTNDWISTELAKTDMRELFASVIECSHDGIYITDGEANTIIINRSYEQITGLKRNELLGRNMRELVDTGVINASGTLLALEQNSAVTIEQKFNTGRWAMITSVPYFNEDGHVTMVVTNVRDITEIHNLQKKLTRQEERNQKYLTEIEVIRRQIIGNDDLVAVDEKMLESMLLVQRVSDTDAIVLILGETGVGKEMVSVYIHQNSVRASKSLIKVNCGAIPPHLVESELFGYERGSFTGANKDGKPGLFEVADKGTLFLDEVGDLPLDVQAKLLRVIQEKEVQRVGALKPRKVDVRIVAATNRDLSQMVAEGTFRTDLFYRLSVFPITIPPLRERPMDVLPLADLILKDFNKKYNKNKELTPACHLLLKSYEWPGNVRELKNVIERAAILSQSSVISPLELALPNVNVGFAESDEGIADSDTLDLKKILEDIESNYIHKAYRNHKNIRRAAKSLSMDAATYVRKKKKYEA